MLMLADQIAILAANGLTIEIRNFSTPAVSLHILLGKLGRTVGTVVRPPITDAAIKAALVELEWRMIGN